MVKVACLQLLYVSSFAWACEALERRDFMKIMKIMKISIFEVLQPDLRRISRQAPRCRAMLKVTRRAFKLQRCSLKSNSGARLGQLVVFWKLTYMLFHVEFSKFLKIPQFILAPHIFCMHSDIYGIDWCKSHVRSFSMSRDPEEHVTPFRHRIL